MEASSCAKRAVELAVRTPFTVAARVLEVTLPLAGQILSRGWAQASRVERDLGGRVDQARFVGKFAVVAGGRQLCREADARLGGMRRLAEERFRPQVVPISNGATDVAVADPAPPPPTEEALSVKGPSSSGSEAAASRESLAIPDYDELSASQVTRRLQGLGEAELAEVRSYEASNRNRKTVLSAIDRLLS
ncbi:MAG: hypothetical protein ACRDV9_03545 [Acidimicrobiia bacterium]